jgi:hypothetical protein
VKEKAMARPNDTSDGDDWVEVDDESDLLDSGDDRGLSPIEGMVDDEMDDLAEMFDPESSDHPDDDD